MGNQDISVELDSIATAITNFQANVVAEMTSLRSDWASYLDGLTRDDWSTEQSCLAFGSSYVSAIEAYDAVMQGLKADVVRYHDNLQTIHDRYLNSDDNAAKAMNTELGTLDDTSAADTAGRSAFQARPNLDDPSTAPLPAPGDSDPTN